jgi:hypothetical protein
MSDAAPIAILVEDEPQIRRFVRLALETEGWHVYEAETLKDGLVEAGTASLTSLFSTWDCPMETASISYAICVPGRRSVTCSRRGSTRPTKSKP